MPSDPTTTPPSPSTTFPPSPSTTPPSPSTTFPPSLQPTPPSLTPPPSTPPPITSVDSFVQQALAADAAALKNETFITISREEHQAVLTKMTEMLSRLPAGHPPKDEALYLEQQLTDMFGFEVVAEQEGHKLDHSLGVMESLPHLKRFPSDTLRDHQQYFEAGLRQTRGAFSWFTQRGELTPLSVARERYTFAVQVDILSSRHKNYAQLMSWYAWRKMIMINPVAQRAVVGCIGDVGPSSWMQHQFGGTPEVIRQGKVWSPASNGRVFLFFINDFDNQVPLGVIDLRYPEKATA